MYCKYRKIAIYLTHIHFSKCMFLLYYKKYGSYSFKINTQYRYFDLFRTFKHSIYMFDDLFVGCIKLSFDIKYVGNSINA